MPPKRTSSSGAASASAAQPAEDTVVGLSETADGLVFEHLHEEEAEFLHEEIFTQRCYAPRLPVSHSKPLIIDVGANIGLFALWALKEWPLAYVVCFEPVPPIVNVLRRNLSSAQAGARRHGHGAVIVPVALGSEDTQSEFHYYPCAPAESTRHPAEASKQRKILRKEAKAAGLEEKRSFQGMQKHACGVRTLSRELHLLGGGAAHQNIDLLKIDAEGDEEAVLQGIDAHDWPRLRQVVVEVHDEGDRLHRVLTLLRAHGLENISVRRQKPTASEGYVNFVPEALRLFHVHAARGPCTPCPSECPRRRHKRKRPCGE